MCLCRNCVKGILSFRIIPFPFSLISLFLFPEKEALLRSETERYKREVGEHHQKYENMKRVADDLEVRLRLSEHTDMTIHWKALEHILMVP
jgi:hypothetical protein